ncbi:MAG: hypothetical protein ACRERD_24340, partial [Candidatus Binatia bacterium]
MRWSGHTAVFCRLGILLAVLLSTGSSSRSLAATQGEKPPADKTEDTSSRSLAAAQSWQANTQLARKLIEEGMTAYQKGRYDEAAQKFTQVRSLLPAHSPTALYLGLAYL